MSPITSLPKTFVAATTIVILTAIPVSVSPAATNLDVPEHQARLQLAAHPGEAQQVLSVQRQLVSEKKQPDGAKNRDVVVVGQIGGMPNVWPDTHADFPWYEGQASFFLVDSRIAAQFAAHAKSHGGAHNCAFCQGLAAKNVQAIAVVNFVDENGEILRVDARELLKLKENQAVVVRGKAKLLAGSMLVIDADGIYVPR